MHGQSGHHFTWSFFLPDKRCAQNVHIYFLLAILSVNLNLERLNHLKAITKRKRKEKEKNIWKPLTISLSTNKWLKLTEVMPDLLIVVFKFYAVLCVDRNTKSDLCVDKNAWCNPGSHDIWLLHAVFPNNTACTITLLLVWYILQ